ncbi:Cullin [Phlyctochytrium arcticum]|nr:Cullin [Phlyctochytrium arcticum]
MFQQVYDLCTAHPKPHTELLYQSIANFLVEHTSDVLKTLDDRDGLVAAYASEWEKYRVASFYANIICQYLNRMLSKARAPAGGVNRHASVDAKVQSVSAVEALAFQVWRENVIGAFESARGNKLITQIIDLIARNRDGYDVPQDIIGTAVRSLVHLGQHTQQPLQLYVDSFEVPFLADTRTYYARASAQYISQSSISEYIHRISQCLADEVANRSQFCDETSVQKVLHECEAQCITAHHKPLLQEFRKILEEEREADAILAYKLLSRSESGVLAMLNIFEALIISVSEKLIDRKGSTIIKDPAEFVEPSMTIHSKYISLCDKVFGSNAAFTAAVDKAFRKIINRTYVNGSAHIPEILARYCDTLLKRSPKQLPEADVDEKLGRVITLFNYVDDKDVFQKFYSRMLAKRLIHQTSTSEDMELNMISRLKASCGVEYTGKLQRMFTDMALSSDLTSGFTRFLQTGNIPPTVGFHVIVLTAGSWPITGTVQSDFTLPVELEQSVAKFTSYYSTQHSGRKLTWLHHLAKVEVKINFMDKRYELTLAMHQLAVLLLFNGSAPLNKNDICQQTKLSTTEVDRVLKTFLDLSLLTEADGSYTVNDKFTHRRTKIKISTSMQSETPSEVNATRQAVEDDRKLYIQAAIVRIMKARKELTHVALVREIIAQAKATFAPSVPIIKKCIEQLIEKQYSKLLKILQRGSLLKLELVERLTGSTDRYVYIS